MSRSHKEKPQESNFWTSQSKSGETKKEVHKLERELVKESPATLVQEFTPLDDISPA